MLIFNWHWNHKRLIDFVPRQPKTISSATIGGQPAEVWEQPKPGSFAGMKFGDDKDNHTVDEKARSAYWECIWCGHHINDTRSERMAICESYRQDYKVLENGIQRTPKEVCFTIPFEAAYDNRFEKTVKNFLHAKEAKSMGNEEKMVLWFLAERAYFYDPKQMDDSAVNISVGTYETDPDKLMPNSHCRQVTADTGKDESAPVNSNLIGLFWFDIWEWDKNSNGRQLSYGVVNSWALLAAQQRFWKVPCARTFIDCSYMPSQVEENAVKYFELIPTEPTKDGQPVLQTPYAWRMAAGAGQNRRMTVPGQNRGSTYSLDNTPGPPKSTHDKNGKMWRMWVKKLTWSNLAFEKQLDSILAKGVEQQLEFIPSSKVVIVDLDGKPSEELVKWSMERCRDPIPNERGHKFSSYQSQLGSRYYKQDTNKYEDFEKQSRPTEFRDTLLMQLAGLAPDGLMGHVAINDK